MHLKTLTLRGFKSFASSTTFHFEPGITCVVGPNGSGKSNVVDALSWVMGEQGAKSLRGGKMEDVIFAGTTGRAPLGRAEVLLTIDNSDGALPIDYAEVTISRTMFRTGGSEYAINGHTARLLDVQELLSDSGIGHEMHVIVGQGQLDAILQATPETRRGFIEEAAGVLKHRKRKEKALRKLDATEANLQRLVDVISEIRRQLKPLSRQAEVARKASVVQAELLDAKARLLADDLHQATEALSAEQAGQEAVQRERERVEQALALARGAEEAAESDLAAVRPRLAAAGDVWYALSGLRERISSTRSIAAERVRHAQALPFDDRPGRDPDTLAHEAADVGREESLLRAEVDRRATALTDASLHRSGVEQRHAEAERRYSAQLRAIADRREGLARLTGQAGSLRSRTEAAAEQIERLAATRDGALDRANEATRRFTALEGSIAGLDQGEVKLDDEYEEAAAEVDRLDDELAGLLDSERDSAQRKVGLAARVDALRLGLERADAGAALVAGEHLDGLLGSLAALVSVTPGYEAAVSAALGPAIEAVAVADLPTALEALRRLKTDDLGHPGHLHETERAMQAHRHLVLARQHPDHDVDPMLSGCGDQLPEQPGAQSPALRRGRQVDGVLDGVVPAGLPAERPIAGIADDLSGRLGHEGDVAPGVVRAEPGPAVVEVDGVEVPGRGGGQDGVVVEREERRTVLLGRAPYHRRGAGGRLTHRGGRRRTVRDRTARGRRLPRRDRSA